MLTPFLEPGDRAIVVHGEFEGKTGVVVAWTEDQKIVLRSDATGRERAFSPGWLAHLPPDPPVAAPVALLPELNRRCPYGVGAWAWDESSQRFTSLEVDWSFTYQAAKFWLDHTPDDHELPASAFQAADDQAVGAEGLHDESKEGLRRPQRTTPVDRDGLQAAIALLEQEQKYLYSYALQDCWLKTWRRGAREYARLHWVKGSGKAPEYVDIKDVAALQDRINQGRALKQLAAAIAYLRRVVDEEGR